MSGLKITRVVVGSLPLRRQATDPLVFELLRRRRYAGRQTTKPNAIAASNHGSGETNSTVTCSGTVRWFRVVGLADEDVIGVWGNGPIQISGLASHGVYTQPRGRTRLVRAGAQSIHWVAVLCLIWHFLYGIPMLNDLSVRIESEEVHRYVFFIAWPSLMSV